MARSNDDTDSGGDELGLSKLRSNLSTMTPGSASFVEFRFCVLSVLPKPQHRDHSAGEPQPNR